MQRRRRAGCNGATTTRKPPFLMRIWWRRTGDATVSQPEYELVDTGVFDDNRYFVVTVTWAKDGPEDLLWQIEVSNAGPDAAVLDVLPTIWYRNRWSWDFSGTKPSIVMRPGTEQFLAVDCEGIGSRVLVASAGPDGKPPQPLFCENDTNTQKLWGTPGPPYPKDGISDYLVHGAASVNPALSGTKGRPSLPRGASSGWDGSVPVALCGRSP